MVHKKLLLTAFCVFLLAGSVSLATAAPRHGGHLAKAWAADKGGVPNDNSTGKGKGDGGPADNPGQGNGPDDNPGKGPDDNPGKGPDDNPGNGPDGTPGPGTPGPDGTPGAGHGQGAGDDGSTGDDPSDSTDSTPGGDNSGKGKAKGADKSGDSGSGSGKSDASDDSSSDGSGKGKSNGNGPSASVDDTVLDDVPAALRSVGVVPFDVLPAELRPSAGNNVLVAPVAGTVLFQNADGDFVPMPPAARLPIGTVVDATQGVITLVGQLADGSAQTAVFSGAKFQVRQAPNGMTALVLRGGSFRGTCGSVSKPAGDDGSAGPTAGAARVRSKKVVRTLWASDHHGKFQTYGRNSVATVRGTVWETVDRCDGTLTRVAVGTVVVHDRRTGHNVTVTAGHSYLARDPLA